MTEKTLIPAIKSEAKMTETTETVNQAKAIGVEEKIKTRKLHTLKNQKTMYLIEFQELRKHVRELSGNWRITQVENMLET